MTQPILIGSKLAHYEIKALLGQGGMATVYLAEDKKHNRKVALKVMRPERVAAIGHHRFLREIETVARLSHPHILPLHDSGASDGQLYYVMPHVAGGTLRDKLNKETQLSLEEAMRLTREIAGALSHAHGHGLVHRDIKPENVLLADGIALVADFGIAHVVALAPGGTSAGATAAPTIETQAQLTTLGQIIGTPLYMAPEQAAGMKVDSRADLYALACVLYEMLTGQPPFNAPTAEALLRLHLLSEARSVSELRAGIPDAVATVLASALAKAPADRPATATRFAESLAIAVKVGRTPTPVTEVEETVTSNNLPRQRSRFIGREKELATCARVFGETQMLTLTGVGGSGKTRLAFRLAESMLESCSDGVWFIDLAALEDETLVPQVVATTLVIKDAQGKAPTELIIDHLRNKSALLYIDNCEHLLAACADLCDRLIAVLPKLKLLLTSREGLAIEGERVFPVRSLVMPVAGETNAEAIGATESVRLFEIRACEANPDFYLGESNVTVVAEICRRLDGIPLAIELAAARTRVLSPEQILKMLDGRFKLLTGGSRSALERHRTSRATVQWSYELLEEDEKDLFLHLAVFSGGWSLPAAAFVSSRDPFEALDLMTRLIDKSLVLSEGLSGKETRYRMLETLRQFGEEQLAESGRAEELRDKHLDYFLESLGTGWITRNTRDIYEDGKRYNSDLDNYRAALGWSLSHRPETALSLFGGLWPLWHHSGIYSEALLWGKRALAVEASVQPELKYEATSLVARIYMIRGMYQNSLDQSQEVLALAREIGNKLYIAMTLSFMATQCDYLGRLDDSVPFLDEALPIAEQLKDKGLMVSVRQSAGLNAYIRGDFETGRDHFAYASSSAGTPRVRPANPWTGFR